MYVSIFSMDDETTTGDDLRLRQGWGWLDLDGGSITLPGPVLALSSIVAFSLYLTWRIDEYEEQLRRRAQAGLCVLLLLGLLALAVLAHHALFDADGRLVVAPAVSWSWWWWGQSEGGASSASDTDDRGSGSGGTSPWAVAAVVALPLVLASHKSSFQMFRPPFYHK